MIQLRRKRPTGKGMAFVVKFAKTVRNNWKKSVFFTGCVAYGVKYSTEVYDDSVIRKAYCEQAKKYGELPLRTGERAQKITVFLNPAAKKGKAKKLFDKNVAPVLNLAGLEVTIVRTEYEGQAKKYMDVLEPTDAILVAGGDGTLAEVVTGLLRRQDEVTFSKVPLGIIPLGYTNTLATSIFPKSKSEAKWMLDSALAVVYGCTKPIDVMRITVDEDRTVFAVDALDWGSFKEAETRAKKYWYFGPLKKYWTYVMSTVGQWPPTVGGKLSYMLPCEGCSQCYSPPTKPQWKWWHIFLPPTVEVPKKDYSEVTNPDCGVQHPEELATLQLKAQTCNTAKDSQNQNHTIRLSTEPNTMSKTDFIKAGWAKIKGQLPDNNNSLVEVQQFSLQPEGQQGHGFYMIDNEPYEHMPITVQLLREKINMFCPANS